MTKWTRTATVLGSGSGTTYEALVHAAQAGIVDLTVTNVVANNSTAGIFRRVQRLNNRYYTDTAIHHISGKTHPGGPVGEGCQTEEEAEAILEVVKGSDLVLYLGYMKKAHPELTRNTLGINTHPGPLPETKGLYGVHVQEAVLEQGLRHSEQTLHHVNEEYDDGDIITSHIVPVMSFDTPETLFDSVQLTEKVWLPVDLQKIFDGKL